MDPTAAKRDFELQKARFDRLLGPQQEPLVVLLKGHLLIEEQLTLLTRHCVANATPLAEARLSFNQTLRLAKSLAGKFFAEDIYEAIRRVNTIRNRLAHEADPTGVDALIAEFVIWCTTQPRLKSLDTIPVDGRLHAALGMVWAYLTGIRDSLRVVRAHIPRPHEDDESTLP